jgi:hypothetical protein
MPSKRYSLERKSPKVLEVNWNYGWKNTTVRLHGDVVGLIPDKTSLKAGSDLNLSDGSTLRIQLQRDKLHISRNGSPLPDTPADPVMKYKYGYQALFVIGISTLIYAVMFTSTKTVPGRVNIQFIIGVVTGIVFTILALFVWLENSATALGIAMLLYGLDTLLVLIDIFLVIGSHNPSLAAQYLPKEILWIFWHIVYLRFMWQGFDGLNALAHEQYHGPELTISEMNAARVKSALGIDIPPMEEPEGFKTLAFTPAV